MFKCYAHNGYISFGNNYIKPCCMSTKKIPITFDSFEDALKLSKQELDTKNWPNSCLWCKSLEDNNKHSLRNKIEFLYPQIYKYELQGNSVQYLELMIDNTCNMNCIMCNENFSSKWNSIHKTQANVNNFDKIVNLLRNSDTSKLTVIRILGGEPFYSKNVLNFLENIEQYVTNKISNITILFNTNCSVFPKEILSILQKFKNIEITLSIDGIKHVAEYFRPGVDWNTVELVYNQWKNFSLENKNLLIIQSCLHMGNIEHKQQLYEWYQKNKCNGLSFNYVQDSHLCVSNLYQNFLKQFNIEYKTKTKIDYSKIFSYIDFFDSISTNTLSKISPLVYNQLAYQRTHNVQI